MDIRHTFFLRASFANPGVGIQRDLWKCTVSAVGLYHQFWPLTFVYCGANILNACSRVPLGNDISLKRPVIAQVRLVVGPGQPFLTLLL